MKENLKLSPEKTSVSTQMSLFWLIASGIITIFLWQFWWGNYVLYPFTILATWFHEMGHGLTAMLLGGKFEKLLVYSNGSGLAYHSGSLFLGRFGRALISAGGLLGPPIVGAWFIISSRNYKHSHYTLMFLGSVLLLSVILWVRSIFGIFAMSLWGIAILWLSLKESTKIQGFAVQFLGVQASISSFHQIDYMFMNKAVIDGQQMVSDTGQIAQQLFLPHWFWAFLIIAITFGLLYSAFCIAYLDNDKN
jgi:hypothetical protein